MPHRRLASGPEKVSAPLHILFPCFCLGSPFLLSPMFPLFLESLKMCKCWSTLRQWDLVLIRPSFCNYKKYFHWRMLPEPIIESLCRVYFPKKLTWKLRKPVKSDWKLIKRFLWEEKETESIYKLPVQSNPVGSSRSTRCQKSHYKVPYKRTRQLGVMQKRHTSTLGFRSISISAKHRFCPEELEMGTFVCFGSYIAAAKIKHSKIINGFLQKNLA